VIVMSDGKTPPASSHRAACGTSWPRFASRSIRSESVRNSRTTSRSSNHAAPVDDLPFPGHRRPVLLRAVERSVARSLPADRPGTAYAGTYYLLPTLSPGSGHLTVAATGERIEAVSAPSQIELILDASAQ